MDSSVFLFQSGINFFFVKNLQNNTFMSVYEKQVHGTAPPSEEKKQAAQLEFRAGTFSQCTLFVPMQIDKTAKNGMRMSRIGFSHPYLAALFQQEMSFGPSCTLGPFLSNEFKKTYPEEIARRWTPCLVIQLKNQPVLMQSEPPASPVSINELLMQHPVPSHQEYPLLLFTQKPETDPKRTQFGVVFPPGSKFFDNSPEIQDQEKTSFVSCDSLMAVDLAKQTDPCFAMYPSSVICFEYRHDLFLQDSKQANRNRCIEAFSTHLDGFDGETWKLSQIAPEYMYMDVPFIQQLHDSNFLEAIDHVIG